MCLGLSLSRLQETQSVRVALPHSRHHPGQLCSALPWYTGGCFSAPDWFGKELLLLTVLGSCKVTDASLQFTYDLLPQGRATVLHSETSGPVAEPSPQARLRFSSHSPLVCAKGLPSSGLPAQFTRLSWVEQLSHSLLSCLDIISQPLGKVMGANQP